MRKADLKRIQSAIDVLGKAESVIESTANTALEFLAVEKKPYVNLSKGRLLVEEGLIKFADDSSYVVEHNVSAPYILFNDKLVDLGTTLPFKWVGKEKEKIQALVKKARRDYLKKYPIKQAEAVEA